MPRPAAAEKKQSVKVEDTPSVETSPKTKTDWDVLYKLKLHPVLIECREYQPIHYSTVACHSRLKIDAKAMKSHMDADHGGCFFVTLATKESPWEGWRTLQKLGVELGDFRCSVCLHEVPFTSASIAKHMKPHLNGNRRMERGGGFRMFLTMSLETELPIEE